MKSAIEVEQAVNIGREIIINCVSPSAQFAVVFEDDSQTGYFYGLDIARKENQIVDALQIYSIDASSGKGKSTVVKIAWSEDGMKAILLIDQTPQAIFDFAARCGYCKSAFPPSNLGWTSFGHEWNDSALDLFQ